MESGRLEAFSDGVFAVAITILALNLVVTGPGHGSSLASQLGHAWPRFAAYAISFATIGIIWVNHHGLFRNFAQVDRTLLFLNLLLLFFVVTIPFATSTFADYLSYGGFDASVAAAIYMGVFEGMSIAFGLLFWWSIKHEQLKVPLAKDAARRAFVRFSIGNVGYVAGIAVAFWNPYVSLVIGGLVAVYYVFEQTPAQRSTTDAAMPDRHGPSSGA